MGVSATHIAVNLFRAHPLYSAKSISMLREQTGDSNSIQAKDDTFKPNYKDSIDISVEYKEKLLAENENEKILGKNELNKNNNSEKSKILNKPNKELTPEEEQVIKDLEKRDAEVKLHEETHLAVGSGIVRGAASYTYQTGPDGKQYAIGGEVQIDMSPIDGDPEATIRKMQQVQRAALAPAEPSGQDYSVASSARSNEAAARAEIAKRNSENSENSENQENESIIKVDFRA